ncbi:MAG: hypothetical protein P8Y47_01045 [Alphaproteobacteria bacterium]
MLQISICRWARLAVTGLMLAIISGTAAQAAEAPADQPAASKDKAAPAKVLTPEQKAELKRIMECDRKLCDIVLHLDKAKDSSLKCDLTKTWLKAEIREAWKKTRVAWPFGDARCSAKFDLSRKLLTGAITEKKYTLKVTPHTIACVVKNGDKKYPMEAIVTPSIDFRDGKATYVKLGVGRSKVTQGSKVLCGPPQK